MAEPDPTLRCTFADAERNHLLDGIRMSVRDKIAFFEAMIELAARSGALQRARQMEMEASLSRRSSSPTVGTGPA